MSFNEYEDCFVWACDGDNCERRAMFPPDSFWSALRELKSRGWLVDRGKDGWWHYCPRCRKTGAEVLAMPVIPKARVR
jgi:hypothetical protein